MYRNDWHTEHRDKTLNSACLIINLLLAEFPITSMLDVGCGHGDWLRAAMECGVRDVIGCDGPWTDQKQLVIPQDLFRYVDLQQPLNLGRRFDLTISTEVAEHISEKYADQIVRSITTHADLVFFGAAIPYQGGYRHINERWPSWWGMKFAADDFAPFDIVRPLVWNEPSVHFWYKQNGIVYVRRSRNDLMERARNAVMRAASGPIRFDVVHPEKFVDIASYNSIAFKPFLKSFPSAVIRKLTTMVLRP